MARHRADDSSRPADDTTPLTEAANPASARIDTLDARGIVGVIHSEDRHAWEALDGALDAIAAVVDDVVVALRGAGRLIYVGAGTSGRLGVLDAAECPPTFSVAPDRVVGVIAGGDEALRRSIEGAEDSPEDGAAAMHGLDVGRDDVVVGIASSGRTPFVLGALATARRAGATTCLVTCNRIHDETRGAHPADHVIELLVGPEVIAGSTRMKAGTATKMALNMITTASMIRLGKVHDNLMVDLRPVNQKLIARARRLIQRIGGVDGPRARELLDAADSNVKVAIVMARRDVPAKRARELLEAAGGILRRALDAG